MDKSKAKAIVDEHLPFMQWDLQVNMWKVLVKYEAITDGSPGCVANCETNVTYEYATITIDPDAHDTEEDVLRSLRHELIHLLLAPFDNFAHTAAELVYESDQAVFEYLHVTHLERAVLLIERMLEHGYGVPLGRRPDYKAPEASPYITNGAVPIHPDKGMAEDKNS